MMTLGSGRRLYVAWAHDRGLEWRGRKAQQQAAAQSHELESSAEFTALQAKYRQLELWMVGLIFAGLLLPYAAGALFLSDYDAHQAWIIGLSLSGMGGWPTAFLIVAMLVRGRAYRGDFVQYFRMRNGEQYAKVLACVFVGFLLLTVACATGLLVSVLPVADVNTP